MYVFDEEYNLLEQYDSDKGRLDERELNVVHKYVIDIEEEGHWETIAEYDNGGKDVEWKIDTPESGHWETYRDEDILFTDYPVQIPDDWPKEQEINDVFQCNVYIPYTEEELVQVAKDKAKLERQTQIIQLKQNLANTDYVITKMTEYNVSGTPMPEDDAAKYADIINQRVQWRAKINELENEENSDA